MPLSMRRWFVRGLVVLAVVGWLLAANLAVRTTPTALWGPKELVAFADRFTDDRFRSLRDGTFERMAVYVEGPARRALEAQAAASPAPMNEAGIIEGTRKTQILMASKGSALVLSEYEAQRSNAEGPRQVREMILLAFGPSDLGASGWHVRAIWQLASASSDPLVPPAEPLETLPSPSPSS